MPVHKVANPVLTGTPMLNLENCTKEDILEYFNHGWNMYETLMASIKVEHLHHVPQPLRKALIFYLGHTATFFMNKLLLAGAFSEEERVNPHFEELFAVGVDEMSWDDMSLPDDDWPQGEEVWEYRAQVHDLIEHVIKTHDLDLPIHWEKDVFWSVIMGVEHEKIHLETSAVLIRETQLEYLEKPEGWTLAPSNGYPPPNDFVSIPAQTVTLGRGFDYPSYGWDNEFGTLTENVRGFRVSKFKVTNAEWLGFINAKGYEREELWDEEGWQWNSFTNQGHPHFWVPLDASKYKYRAVFEVIDMPWDWPVEVNYHEAKAYANWKGLRLPTEAEWRALAGFPDPPKKTADGKWDPPAIDPVHRPLDQLEYNLNMKFHSSTPVDMFPPNEYGVYDALGNAWEHGSTEFDGLPGFKVHDLYLDFSTPTFDTRHTMIMGGCWIACGNEASVWSRYAFRRHFHQMVSFRLVDDSAGDGLGLFEGEEKANAYTIYHYGKAEDILPAGAEAFASGLDYAAAVAKLTVDALPEGATGLTALDVGCAVGRLALELSASPAVASVSGIDLSADFIKRANELKAAGAGGTLSVPCVVEGEICCDITVSVPAEAVPDKVTFAEGDVAAFSDDCVAVDVLVVSDVLEYMRTPMALVSRFSSLVKAGGTLVVACCYKWDEAITPKENWIGAVTDDSGATVSTKDALTEILAADFDLVSATTVPSLKPQSARSYDLSLVDTLVFRRK